MAIKPLSFKLSGTYVCAQYQTTLKIPITVVLLFLVLVVVTTSAQTKTNNHGTSFSGSVWLDFFAGPDGGVFYPQYSFRVRNNIVTFTGYGFLEKAPRESWFTNHVNTLTASRFPVFSVRTETGGNLEKDRYFFQVGPQANLHEIIPPLKRVMSRLIVAQLPKLAGLRPPNTLIAGGTRNFSIAKGVDVSAEGYYRFFPGGRPDYAEFWGLIHPKKTNPVSFGVFILNDGGRVSTCFGVRITP